jgi:putative SOS response-associated peptidase YedK
MCGRFTLRTPLTVLAQQFLFELGPLPADIRVVPRFNVAPTQTVATVRRQAAGQKRELAFMHWGLVPGWAKDPKIASTMINARGETVAEKPAFRAAFARRRCLILADGFYEWKKEGKQKLPHYFQTRDERPFALAGLWECWRGPRPAEGAIATENPPLESCTIVTTTANELCSPFHDRMPVILDPADYDLWLDPAVNDAERIKALLAPYPACEMQSRAVNPRVNNVRNDDEGVLVADSTLFR